MIEYSATTDHEKDDSEKKKSDWLYSSTLGGTLSNDCLAGGSIDVRRERSSFEVT